jgi:HlyD family secretion protein
MASRRSLIGRPLIVISGVGLLAVAGLAGYSWLGNAEPVARFRFASVDAGPVVSTVSATGVVNPVVTVLVGSQLSGQITELLADFNTKVTLGQVIARLDTDQIAARMREAGADLASARAALAQQRASLERTRADANVARSTLASNRAQILRSEAQLKDAEREYARRRELLARGAANLADFERAETGLDSARAQLVATKAQADASAATLSSAEANIGVVEAQIAGAEAQVAQREAALERVKVDLDRSEIRSPIEGVVIQRSVDVGQTVAASLQAPTLFTIAQDLRQIEVHASVDEGDVGRVAPGQEVTFTVTAYASPFRGEVLQTRLGPQTIQNVVTYTVVIGAENADLRLLPGMTATVRIVTERRDRAVRVPNAALRYRPPGTAGRAPGEPGAASAPAGGSVLDNLAATLTERLKLSPAQQTQLAQMVDDARQEFRGLRTLGLSPEEIRPRIQAIRRSLDQRISTILNTEQRAAYERFRAERLQQAAEGQAGGTPGRVFVLGPDGHPKPVPVRLGISDGTVTEMISGELRSGQDVIVGGGLRPGPGGAPPGPRFGL